jgi:hypothetical protein
VRRRLDDRLAVGGQRDLGAIAHLPGVADLDRPASGGEPADVGLAARVGEHRRELSAAVGREIDEEDLRAPEVPALGIFDLNLEGGGTAPVLTEGQSRQEQCREKEHGLSHG